MKYFIIICFSFAIGTIVGINRQAATARKACPVCPEDLSIALEGCEQAAADVENLLERCEYNYDRCGQILEKVFYLSPTLLPADIEE